MLAVENWEDVIQWLELDYISYMPFLGLIFLLFYLASPCDSSFALTVEWRCLISVDTDGLQEFIVQI